MLRVGLNTYIHAYLIGCRHRRAVSWGCQSQLLQLNQTQRKADSANESMAHCNMKYQPIELAMRIHTLHIIEYNAMQDILTLDLQCLRTT